MKYKIIESGGKFIPAVQKYFIWWQVLPSILELIPLVMGNTFNGCDSLEGAQRAIERYAAKKNTVKTVVKEGDYKGQWKNNS